MAARFAEHAFLLAGFFCCHTFLHLITRLLLVSNARSSMSDLPRLISYGKSYVFGPYHQDSQRNRIDGQCIDLLGIFVSW